MTMMTRTSTPPLGPFPGSRSPSAWLMIPPKDTKILETDDEKDNDKEQTEEDNSATRSFFTGNLRFA